MISCKVGKWTWWNYYGVKREEGEYSSRLFLPDKKTGVKIGKWIEWYENKEKKSEFNYDLDGNRDGSWIEWYRNGNKELEWNYKEGNPIGKQYWWYENGQKWIEKIYKDGEIISETLQLGSGSVDPLFSLFLGYPSSRWLFSTSLFSRISIYENIRGYKYGNEFHARISVNYDKTDALLKINIFCSLIQNKIEEADFLNSLLLDTNENDEYFQKIYFNLKNNLNELIDISALTYNDDSMDM